MPATAARNPSGARSATRPARSPASSAPAAAAVECGRLASSSAEPCVSARAASPTRRDNAGNTSSIREASDQSPGSRSITSSSTPTVQGASAAAGFQWAQAGSVPWVRESMSGTLHVPGWTIKGARIPGSSGVPTSAGDREEADCRGMSEERSTPRLERWVPGVRVARTYDRSWLRPDLVAGVVLAAILVPQGMAYAELAGLPAVTGLYTTIACLRRLRRLRARRGCWCSGPTRRSRR